MIALAICSVFLIVGCNHDTEETSVQGLISNTEEAVTQEAEAVTEQADDAQTNLEAEVEEVEPETEAEPEVEEAEPEAEPEADTEDSEEETESGETEEDGGVISNILEQVESAINKPDNN